ncbi:unnamed protein product [Acanthosepion pharaonis]|uniref:TRASH domain-containing protein n=1 Tax=Acanthosepion pharaonis TaxID=158019 RepID=A0A812CS07_ACAPH|nr:unnamed protein product [Sepia pharaonis]
MDVASDTTSAVAASSGDGGETKSDGSPKPVTTESLKSSGSSQLENGNDASDEQNASANSLSPEKMDVTSEKSLSPPVLTKETDNSEQNGGKKENQEMENKDSKDTDMEVDPQDAEQNAQDKMNSDKMCQPPSLDNFDKAKDSSPYSNAPTLDKTDDNDDDASVSSKIDSKEEMQSNHEEEAKEREKEENDKEFKSETDQNKDGEKKEEESDSKDKTKVEMKDNENDANSKKKDEAKGEDVKEDENKESKEKSSKTKTSKDETKDKTEKSEKDAKDSSDKSKAPEKPDIGRISPRRTRSQNRTKPVTTYLEEDFDDEDDLDLQITAVSGGVDAQLTSKSVSRSGKSDTKIQGSKSSKSIQKCIVCHKVGKCKYNIVRNGDIKHLCDDECFRQFRVNPTVYLRTTSPSSAPTPVPTSTVTSHLEPPPAPAHYKTCSVCQLMNINTNKHFLNWQGLDFCGEECLGKFQSSLGGTCSFCGSQVPPSAKAKYCLKLGTEIKQFCGTQCHAQFKKRLKVCSYCQKDLTNVSDSFMAPVGWEQGVFKDFCSQFCIITSFSFLSHSTSCFHSFQSRPRPCFSLFFGSPPVYFFFFFFFLSTPFFPLCLVQHPSHPLFFSVCLSRLSPLLFFFGPSTPHLLSFFWSVSPHLLSFFRSVSAVSPTLLSFFSVRLCRPPHPLCFRSVSTPTPPLCFLSPTLLSFRLPHTSFLSVSPPHLLSFFRSVSPHLLSFSIPSPPPPLFFRSVSPHLLSFSVPPPPSHFLSFPFRLPVSTSSLFPFVSTSSLFPFRLHRLPASLFFPFSTVSTSSLFPFRLHRLHFLSFSVPPPPSPLPLFFRSASTVSTSSLFPFRLHRLHFLSFPFASPSPLPLFFRSASISTSSLSVPPPPSPLPLSFPFRLHFLLFLPLPLFFPFRLHRLHFLSFSVPPPPSPLPLFFRSASTVSTSSLFPFRLHRLHFLFLFLFLVHLHHLPLLFFFVPLPPPSPPSSFFLFLFLSRHHLPLFLFLVLPPSPLYSVSPF